MIHAANVILFLWLIFLCYWLLHWRSVKPVKETAWRALGLRWTLLWMAVLVILISRFIFHENGFHVFDISSQPITLVQIIGIILTGIGLIIAIVARKTLADNWSSDVELKENHKLITEGIYKYVRNPIYTGIDIMGLGTIIVDQSIMVTVFYIGIALFLIYKMNKEEALLLKHFSKEYFAYMKKTKALIPFIY
jgi:protein-S-isoprenylcysteine O-methyltransferase Ste14